MYELVIEEFAKAWLSWYKKRPFLTIFLTIAFFGIPLAGIIIDNHFSEKRRFERNYSDPQVKAQIEELDKVSKNLKELSLFVTLQQERVANQHEALKKLHDEEQQLVPVVNAQRELVEGVFALQDARQTKQKWWDMGIGFFLGIISSIIGSFIFAVIRIEKQKGNGQ